VSPKRVGVVAAAILLLAGGAALAYVLYVRSESADVTGSPSTEFVPSEPTPSLPQPTSPSQPLTVEWPLYGFDLQRLRNRPSSLRPPFRRLWVFRAHELVEFPPAVGYGRLFVTSNTGVTRAIDVKNGHPAWAHHLHRCTAASPALVRGIVYAAYMNRPPCNSTKADIDGLVVAYDARTGKTMWRKRIGPSETSPLVANGLVYVGDWRNRVYALDARTGKVRWSYETGGKVKGAAALAGGRLYVGSYDGHVYALAARTGKLIWRASAQERLGGLGTFYSTPAVAYGRVYIGSTDGKVYSYGATTGELRWSHSTGGYVYASPAVSHQRVYVGSYDGNFYAFDAATGEERWKFKANGKISGSAAILGNVVYFSTLEGRTYGLDTRTGKQVWAYPAGAYAAVVADRTRVYLIGFSRIFALVPERKLQR
jgi:outer membrane protein assembly factor BamB